MSQQVISVIINIVLQLAMIALIFGLAYKFGWSKFVLFIRKRQDATMEVMDEAESMKQEATKIHDEAEQKLKDINNEASEILARAEDTAKKIAAERNEKMEAELARKRELAEKQLANDRKRLEQQMEQEIIEKATEVASQFLTSKATPESTEEQIGSFLEKLGDE